MALRRGVARSGGVADLAALLPLEAFPFGPRETLIGRIVVGVVFVGDHTQPRGGGRGCFGWCRRFGRCDRLGSNGRFGRGRHFGRRTGSMARLALDRRYLTGRPASCRSATRWAFGGQRGGRFVRGGFARAARLRGRVSVDRGVSNP